MSSLLFMPFTHSLCSLHIWEVPFGFIFLVSLELVPSSYSHCSNPKLPLRTIIYLKKPSFFWCFLPVGWPTSSQRTDVYRTHSSEHTEYIVTLCHPGSWCLGYNPGFPCLFPHPPTFLSLTLALKICCMSLLDHLGAC